MNSVVKQFFRCLLALAALLALPMLVPAAAGGQGMDPSWTFHMKVRPFDVLYPDTTIPAILSRVDAVKNAGANTIIFYIEEEQMYRSFVDEAGFASIALKISTLTGRAHAHGLKVICYINGLEVMAHNAATNPKLPTLARNYPAWLQKDIFGHKMSWTGIQNTWITPDMEDSWASPYSGFRQLVKRRIGQLAQHGVDAVYIDAVALPGMQDYGDRWASADTGFASAFYGEYHETVPAKIDWNNSNWRKFVYFRHEALAGYLADLAASAWASKIVPFFEQSTLDTSDGTLLGNDPSFTVLGSIALSPEIEPQGDFKVAFRTAKFSRDIEPSQPILYLGWPGTADEARQEFSVAMTESGNYYPTAGAPYPVRAFSFMDSIQGILADRSPLAQYALIYSTRNKDFTYPVGSWFSQYDSTFNQMADAHLPFKVVPLEHLTAPQLAGCSAVVTPELQSLTDSEFGILNRFKVAPVGVTGNRDQWYSLRSAPLKFAHTVSVSTLKAALPFSLTAPAAARIEYYSSRTTKNRWYIFAFAEHTGGTLTVSAASPMSTTIYKLDSLPKHAVSKVVSTSIADHLYVIELQW